MMTLSDKLTELKPVLLKEEHKPTPEILLNSPRSTIKTLIKFCNTHFLRPGRICTGIGPAGTGKTNISEAVVSSHINPYCDTFQIKVTSSDNRPLLFVDFERTKDEILDGTDRIKRRIKADNNPDCLTDERFKNTYIHGFLQYAKTEDKINELQRLIELYKPYLVVLDGAASLVYDVNDTKECVYTINLLLATANEFNLSYFCTVHPNPGQQSDFKPRGVFGSELVRQSESVFLLKRAPDDRNIRILTTDFMHGKNRSGSDNLEAYFKWDEMEAMFMSCEYAKSAKPSKINNINEAITETVGDRVVPYNDLISLIMENYQKSEPTAKRWVTDAVKMGLLFKRADGYGLTPF
jgi:hypothetical protein